MQPSALSMTRVPVALGERSYDILIGRGLVEAAGGLIRAALPGRRLGIVADAAAAALHLPALERALEAAGFAAHTVTVPPGEASKSWSELQRVTEAVLAARLERGDAMLAFGGGVIGDLAGFAAAIARRGMRFVQVPTTLLAQVDSSVGGKTAINSPSGKNLIGAFHQPALVLADTALLDTLPAREMRAGYAEVIKYGLLGDHGFYQWLEGGAWRGVFSGGAEREEAVAHACRAKAAIVARDETETGDRALLNLGHTFGHALEAVTGYEATRLIHGEAVAIGMALAFRFSARLGLASGQDATRMARHLETVGLPTALAQVPGGVGGVEALLAAIAQDKKVAGGVLTFILVRGIGEAFIARGIEAAAVRDFLIDEGAAA